MSTGSTHLYFPDSVSDAVPDCLVLRMTETNTAGKSKSTFYILYDTYHSTYLIRGQKRTADNREMTYSFESFRKSSIRHFIRYLLPEETRWDTVLYRMTDLPANKNEITYDSLCIGRNRRNELSRHSNQPLSKTSWKTALSILKEIANDY